MGGSQPKVNIKNHNIKIRCTKSIKIRCIKTKMLASSQASNMQSLHFIPVLWGESQVFMFYGRLGEQRPAKWQGKGCSIGQRLS